MKTALIIKHILLLTLFFSPFQFWGQEKAEEKTEYVIIDSSSNDAVILDQADFFESKPLCRLKQNQAVTVTDSTDGEYVMIIANCNGENIRGWVKKLILAKEVLKINQDVSESAGAKSNPIAAKGIVGFDPIDTTGFKNQEIPLPWNEIDLTGYEAKIFSSDLPKFNHRIVWPVVGATLIGATTIILLSNNDDADEDDDTQTPLILNIDLAESACNETITVDVLANDQGDDLILQSAQSTNAAVDIMDNDLIVSEISGSTCIVYYTVIDAYGNSGISTLTISVDYPLINAQNDDYSMETNSSLSGNLITNDSGQELSIIAFTQPSTGSFSVQPNGDFTYQAQSDYSGIISFSYDIQDACEQVATATVSITINEIPCEFDVTFESTNASCGFDDGSIISYVTPDGNYTFQWSNGLIEQDILNAFSGDYILSVTDTTLNCTLDFNVTVDENPPSYISDLVVSPAICPDQGSINFLVSSPDGGPLDINVESDTEIIDFSVPSGQLLLGDFMAIEEGFYSISVSPSNSLGTCVELLSIEIESQVNLIIDINDIINPSSISANDGAIFGTILSPILPPFELFVNGNPILIDDVTFALEGLAEGSYSLYVISSDGCHSDTILVDLIADPRNEPRFSFIVAYSLQNSVQIPELPGNNSMNDISFQLEFSTGEKTYHPIIGMAYYTKDLVGNFSTQVWEISGQFEKNYRIGKLDLHARTGPFMQAILAKEGIDKMNLRNYGIIFHAMMEYKLYELNISYPMKLSLRIGGRLDIASEFNNTGYFIGLVLH